MTDENPYAPPKGHADEGAALAEDDRGVKGPFVKASRWARLGGWVIDGLFAWGLWAGGTMVSNLFGSETRPDSLESALVRERELRLSYGVFLLLTAAVSLGVQAWLIARRGQSLGKLVMRTRIVLADGTVAGLHRGFVLRSLPIRAIALLPSAAVVLQVHEEEVEEDEAEEKGGERHARRARSRPLRGGTGWLREPGADVARGSRVETYSAEPMDARGAIWEHAARTDTAWLLWRRRETSR